MTHQYISHYEPPTREYIEYNTGLPFRGYYYYYARNNSIHIHDNVCMYCS